VRLHCQQNLVLNYLNGFIVIFNKTVLFFTEMNFNATSNTTAGGRTEMQKIFLIVAPKFAL